MLRDYPKKQISKEVTAYNQVFYPEIRSLLRRYSRDNSPSGAFAGTSDLGFTLSLMDMATTLLQGWSRHTPEQGAPCMVAGTMLQPPDSSATVSLQSGELISPSTCDKQNPPHS